MSQRHLRYSFFKWEVGSEKWEVKKIITSYFLLLTCCLLGCAPKVVSPPQYKDMELTLDEIVKIAKDDVDTLKVIAGITIEKDDKPHSYFDALILLKKPGGLHMRVYKFGIPVGNFLFKEDEAYNLSSGEVSKLDDRLPRNLKDFSRELYRLVFWWEGLTILDCRFEIEDCKKNTVMSKNENEYVIKTSDREIHLDRAALLPKTQEITLNNKKILILYAEPKREGDFWYPSSVKIEAGSYRFSIIVEKLFVNPQIEENDFKEPVINSRLNH